MSRRTRTVLAALTAIPLALAFAACASSAPETPGGEADPETPAVTETVTIGVVGKSDEQWIAFVDAAAAEGIEVELVDFSSYEQPNPALSNGDLDLNQFQHIVYLAQYNEAAGDDLTPIGATAIYPLGLYSIKYDSVEDIPDGETVAVPDDASNQARALLVLQSAGLIELKSGGTIFSDLADVDTEASRVSVTALEAAILATSLPDVAASILNNDFVENAGLSFEDAIAQDDPSDPNALPYVNIFVSRAADADNPLYQRVVEIFQNTPSVQQGLQTSSGNTAVLLQTPASELVASLAKVQADIAAR